MKYDPGTIVEAIILSFVAQLQSKQQKYSVTDEVTLFIWLATPALCWMMLPYGKVETRINFFAGVPVFFCRSHLHWHSCCIAGLASFKYIKELCLFPRRAKNSWNAAFVCAFGYVCEHREANRYRERIRPKRANVCWHLSASVHGRLWRGETKRGRWGRRESWIKRITTSKERRVKLQDRGTRRTMEGEECGPPSHTSHK